MSSEQAGIVVDLGATWFWHNEPLVRSLLDRFGLGSFPQSSAGDALFEPADQPVQRLGGNPIDAPSHRFRTGAQSLATALARHIGPEVLSLADPVHGIRHHGGHVVVHTAGGTHIAEQVIIAVPPALALEAIAFGPDPPDPLRRIASATSVWMGEFVKAVAVFDEPFWRDDELAGAAISHRGPFGEFHDHSAPGAGPGAIFGFAPAALLTGTSEPDIAEVFRAQLSRMFGGRAGSPRQILATNWATERRTTPTRRQAGVSTAGFGHEVFRVPFGDGRLHWASTETADAYAGHIEGAIRAGLGAAGRVEDSLLGR